MDVTYAPFSPFFSVLPTNMGDTINALGKGERMVNGPKGRARGARSSIAGIRMEKGKGSFSSAKDQRGDSLAETEPAGFLGVREVNLEMG